MNEDTQRERTAAVVRTTQAYYDGAADVIYREIWGENLHLGHFATPEEPLPAAMERSNALLAERLSPEAGDRVLDLGCGYGAFARHLARQTGCRVVATNISEKELARGREQTDAAGLSGQVTLERADFHELPYEDGSFQRVTSQEAFLHAADKARVLRETHRVLRPGGTLAFSDLLVRRGTPDAVRTRIYERVQSPDMWDAPDYLEGLAAAGFSGAAHEDWSAHVAPTYAWVRDRLEARRPEFETRLGREIVDRTSAALQFWVESAQAGHIGWACFVAERR